MTRLHIVLEDLFIAIRGIQHLDLIKILDRLKNQIRTYGVRSVAQQQTHVMDFASLARFHNKSTSHAEPLLN